MPKDDIKANGIVATNVTEDKCTEQSTNVAEANLLVWVVDVGW